MYTNEEIKEKHRDYVMEIYSPELDKMLDEARFGITERIDAILEEMEKEIPIEERKRNSYDIGYVVALKEARLRIRKIFKVD